MRGQDLINTKLDDELIVEIFRHLDSMSSRDACSLVCKRWLGLERPRRDAIRIGGSGITDALVRLLARRFTNAQNVYINEIPISLPARFVRGRRINRPPLSGQSVSEQNGTGTSSLSDSGLADVGDGFKRLEKLSLIWCSNVTDVGLSSIAEKSKVLKSLDIQACHVGDKGLAAVGKYCTQLEDLNLWSCKGLTDTGLILLVIGCGRTLKSLGLAACAKITDASLAAIQSLSTTKACLAVAKGCPQLKSLRLQCRNLTDEALQAVGKFCQFLELLALYSFQNFTDKSLCAIGKGCKKLKNLTFIDCNFLSDMGLDSIAVGCTELMHLEVNGCQNIGTSRLQSIRKILHKVENDALCEIGLGCKDLQSLNLADCSGIGDESICGIAKGCKNLKRLHISRCPEVGTKGIITVGQVCRSLTDLTLKSCNRVGDLALISVRQCCSLLHLNVNDCNRIGDAGIIAISRGCPRLSYLDVGGLQNLGDKAMEALSEGCPLLRDLVLSHCLKITDAGLGYIAKKCKLLESCDMGFCHGITDAGIATVITSCPKIKRASVEDWKVSPRTRVLAGAIISYISADSYSQF
ncbi:F-box/LRR-repeat protein 4 [Abeliophyllum distichum]|uniref:F-box/LRR-repeat protein 4 n=1 Tax=Abeliophyllum distichum TaxID=126358 RepID=A0ABD1T2F7_9LAMI